MLIILTFVLPFFLPHASYWRQHFIDIVKEKKIQTKCPVRSSKEVWQRIWSSAIPVCVWSQGALRHWSAETACNLMIKFPFGLASSCIFLLAIGGILTHPGRFKRNRAAMHGGRQRLAKGEGTYGASDTGLGCPVGCTRSLRKLNLSSQRGCREDIDDCGFYFRSFAQGWSAEGTGK